MMANDNNNAAPATAEVWWSSELEPGSMSWYKEPADIPYALARQPDLAFAPPSGDTRGTAIPVNAGALRQEMLGIGISMEESTVANLRRMSAPAADRLLRLLLDREEGAGFSLVRLTFGTSDFTGQPFYTYDDMPEGEEDFGLTRFSIARDIELGIVGTLRRLRELAPDLKFFASSWSPPAWMKTNGQLRRGSLKAGAVYTEALARYYRLAIEAYEAEGIPIYAMTLQNEPLLETDYPSCHMPPERQRELAIALRRELDAAGLKTRIWIFDHNFEDARAYAAPILNDAAAAAAANGIALHDYGGEPETMLELAAAYPAHSLHLTERSVWGTAGAARIVRYLRSGASSYNAWVTMLDSCVAPHQWVGTPDPTLLVQDADDPERTWATPELYLTAQFARFVRPGARLIETPAGAPGTVTHAAFLNADGLAVVIVVNDTASEQAVRIVTAGCELAATVPPKTVATYRWPYGRR